MSRRSQPLPVTPVLPMPLSPRLLRSLPRLSQPLRCKRHASTTPQNPFSSRPDEPIFPNAAFEKQTSFFLDLSKRFIKFSAVGACALVATGCALFEGTQMWVEYVEFAQQHDQIIRHWEWDLEPDNWGPTDPGLGYKARHSVRASWMAQNWGSGRPVSVISETPSKPGGLNVVDADLARAHEFLNTAISIAEQRSVNGSLQPQTLATLLAFNGSVLERINDPSQAAAQYARAWAGSSGKGPFATYVASRLGDLYSRLGRSSDALAWWARAIQLAQGSGTPGQLTETPTVPKTIPSSPFQQRVLSSILVSLSAFYATSGRLEDARNLEEESLRYLRTFPTPDPLSSVTPPQALHSLFLLHRSSLLSIHLAEVIHSCRGPTSASLHWLRNAAQSSERISQTLIDPSADIAIPRPIPSNAQLSNIYLTSKALRRPALNLLRDSRRSAAEAWTLMGILNESTDPRAALACYERGLFCAGINLDTSYPDAVETEWKPLHSNYIRLKEQMDKP